MHIMCTTNGLGNSLTCCGFHSKKRLNPHVFKLFVFLVTWLWLRW
jgi:hypothetical protein